MRTLGHTLLVVLLAATLAAAAWGLWSTVSRIDPLQRSAFSDVVRSTTYELAADRWLEFPLPNRNGLKVLSTALVSSEAAMVADARWGYTLEFQLLGAGDQPIREWSYHYRAGITRYVDPASGRFQPRSYVADMQAMPADSRVSDIAALELAGAKRLRIRLHDYHPELQRVLVRCYVHEQVAAHKLGFLWQRLDDAKRERIARVSVLGAELLREEEKHNLLRWEWSPIGPAGVREQDFEARTLFVLHDTLGEAVDEQVLPEGIYADRYTRGVVALPEGVWDLQLELIAVGDQGGARETEPVQVRWSAQGGGEQWQLSLEPGRKTPYRRDNVTGGWLEFVATQPVIARVYLFGAGGWLAMGAAPQRLRTYLIEVGSTVEYRVEHVQGAPTPVRIDLRALWREGEPLPRSVRYQLLDSAGRELGAGDIAVEETASLYDQVALAPAGERVSEAVRRYFYLPSRVATIRLSAPAAVVVSAYSRPDDLLRRVRVPEDYQDLDWDPARHPAWFLVRPLDHDALRLQQRAVDLVLQPRPPQVDAQIQAGLFDWNEYQPHGAWRARKLLVPRTASHEVPARSRAAVFAPLAANRALQLPVLGQVGRQQVTPTLIYLGSGAAPSDVAVDIDGVTVATTRLFSARAQLQLPPVSVGEHRLHIRTAAEGRWWINYTHAADGAQLLRQALRIGAAPLEFDYQKQGDGEEVLSGALYCSTGERAELRASIDGRRAPGLAPRLDWTFLERDFDIDAGAPREVPVLDTPDTWVSSGQVFFLPLGEDLPAGGYRISLRTHSAAPCYLNLYRIAAGQSPLRRLYREGDLAAAGQEQ